MEKSKGHVLCVDDDADTREMLTAFFRIEGYDVSVSGSVAEGIHLALEHGVEFDLILLDWVLRDGTGIELCNALRSMELTAPILFCSGVELTREQMNDAIAAGAQGFVSKPIDINGILQRVSDLTNQHQPSN